MMFPAAAIKTVEITNKKKLKDRISMIPSLNSAYTISKYPPTLYIVTAIINKLMGRINLKKWIILQFYILYVYFLDVLFLWLFQFRVFQLLHLNLLGWLLHSPYKTNAFHQFHHSQESHTPL